MGFKHFEKMREANCFEAAIRSSGGAIYFQ
jgi:hypothetical protein